MEGAKGDVTYCTGQGHHRRRSRTGSTTFNAKSSPDLTVKPVEFPASADEQRNQFIQRQQAKSGDCDVFYSDVIWTAEFASQKWLYDLTPYIEQRKDEFIAATLETVTYDGKIWGAPTRTDAAFLYYRTDKVDEAAATWQEVYEQAEEQGRHRLPGRAVRGPDLRLPRAGLRGRRRGALRGRHRRPTIDSPENVKALEAHGRRASRTARRRRP